MNISRKPRQPGWWGPLALCGLALTGGVAGAAPTIGPTWTARYDAPGRVNAATDLLVDSAGNSYAVVQSDNGADGIQVVKYNKSGQRLWAEGVSPDGNIGFPITAALDTNGNVVVCGYHETIDTEQSIAVVKFSSTGNIVWDLFYRGPENSYAFPGDIAVDSAGDVYVTGETPSDTNDSVAALVVKLDAADGDIVWEALVSDEEETYRHGNAIVADNEGGIYVTGGTAPGNDDFADFLTVKLNAENGTELWTSTFAGPDGARDTGIDIALSGTGVVVTGPSGGANGIDYQTLKYNKTDGAQVWATRYDGPAAGTDSDDNPTDLAVDAAGNVYVTGSSVGTARDYATVKYNGTSGTQTWVARYDGPGEEEELDADADTARRVAVDANGNVYVTGEVLSTDFQYDIGTVKYNSAGQQQWIHLFTNRDFNDQGVALGLDGSGNVYVAGTTEISDELDYSLVVLKYLATGRGTPAPRVAKPTFTFSETAKDKLVCFREEGETFCDEATTSTFKVNSTATMQDVDITTFDEETFFSLSVGGLELERALGDDPRYVPGRTTATFTEFIFDDDDRERKALTIVVSWPRGKLRVTVTSTPFFDGGIMAGDFLDQETGRVTDNTSASVALGDFTQEFDVAVTGRVTSRTTRDEEFIISNVTLNGRGTGL